MIDIYPKEGERSFFAGKTGTGKTTTMILMGSRFWGDYQIQVLATKEDKMILALPVPIVRTIHDLKKYPFPDYPMVVYYPDGNELHDQDILDGWCEWIFQRGNTVAIIDELTQVAYGTMPKPGFLNMYTRGRSQNVTVLAGNQRPVSVPAIVYTEAENFYKFYLGWNKDREKVMQFTTNAMATQVKDKYGFHYYNPNRSNDVYYISNLMKGVRT